MIETDILTALQTAGIAAVAASDDQPLPVLALGRTLDPLPEAYFEFVQIINNRTGQYIGNERVYQGIFRILLHWPINDEGFYPAMTLLGKVGDYFPKEKRLISGTANVQIYSEPDMGSEIRGNAELIFPLSLLYRCFSP